MNGIANVSKPCSSVLEPVNTGFVNAKGVALVYKVQLTPNFPLTSYFAFGFSLKQSLDVVCYKHANKYCRATINIHGSLSRFPYCIRFLFPL
ncbi:hypothetical protein GC097_20345 [Paenibacillus sp. LMG 31457]|uniref:Uncharacterized protein n=1 Tax=Paenibacillus planticolens TaxID=2654976 RepID=A0ABX1ZQZ8_9BACL|nr:hypothetical protein [Paenibacillus planticolens]